MNTTTLILSNLIANFKSPGWTTRLLATALLLGLGQLLQALTTILFEGFESVFPGAWSNIASQTDIPGSGGVEALTDPSPSGGQGFYRLGVRLP